MKPTIIFIRLLKMKGFKVICLCACVVCLTVCKNDKKNFAEMSVNTEFDFGKIKVDDTIQAVFSIENKSNIDLKIININASCGCILPVITDSLVKKHKSKNLKFQYVANTEDQGFISLPIVLETNTKPSFTVLKIIGTIEE